MNIKIAYFVFLIVLICGFSVTEAGRGRHGGRGHHGHGHHG
jgi:hypothetical protein